MDRERILILLSRWRVNAATVLVVGGFALARPTGTSIAECLPLLACGLGLRMWARGHIERNLYLTQTGPYAFVRHPLYIGSFLVTLGLVVMSRSGLVALLFVPVFLVMYIPKALREERFLRGTYGSAYDQYAAWVGAVLPRLHGKAPVSLFAAEVQGFSWRRVFQHREWQAWLGVLLALVAMWALTGNPPIYSRVVHQLAHCGAPG